MGIPTRVLLTLSIVPASKLFPDCPAIELLLKDILMFHVFLSSPLTSPANCSVACSFLLLKLFSFSSTSLLPHSQFHLEYVRVFDVVRFHIRLLIAH